jgi:hypothetical protein
VLLLLFAVAIARIALLEPASGTAIASPTDDLDSLEPDTYEEVATPTKLSMRESAEVSELRTADEAGNLSASSALLESETEPTPDSSVPEYRVEGQLLAPNGERIVGAFASVSFTNEHGISVTASILANDTYRASGLSPGTWWLEADAEGFSPRTLELFLPEGQSELTQDIELEPRVVIVVCALTPDGQPLNLLNDRIFAVASNEPPSTEFIDEVERLQLTYGAASRLYNRNRAPEVFLGFVERIELLKQPPVFVSLFMNRTLLQTKFVPAGKTLVTFVLSDDDIKELLASIRYRLVDSVTGIELTASVEMLFASNRASFSHNATGEIVHSGIAPGFIELSAEVNGYQSFKSSLTINAGDNLDLGDIALEMGSNLKGIVVDELGNAISNAAVHHQTLKAGPNDKFRETVLGAISRSGLRVGWSTDKDGRFSIALSPGRHRLWAEGPKGFTVSANTVIDSSKPDSEVRIVLLERKRITFIDQYRRYSEATLRISDTNGIVVDDQVFEGVQPLNAKLPKGSYHAQLSSEGVVVLNHSFDVAREDLTVHL